MENFNNKRHRNISSEEEEEETTNKSNSKRIKLQTLTTQRSFGEDIYTEILLRLPVKSVVKFQSVSKLWFSIVSSPRFRQSHASLHTSSAASALHFQLFETNRKGSALYRVLPLNIDRPGPIHTKGFHLSFRNNTQFSHFSRPRHCTSSCNGLLLLKSYDDTYYVYNPTTKECKVIDIPLLVTKNKYVCASLAFDPSQSLHYRVVFLWRQPHEHHKFQLEVYSSATGECRSPVNNTLVGSFDYYENRGIFCNGAIHWLPMHSTSIFYFNVHTECIKELQIPCGRIHYFGESHGHVHLVKSDKEFFYQSSFLSVFELKSDYSGWFLKCKVELASITSALPQVNAQECYGTSLSVLCDEDEDDSALLLWVRNEWVEYNFKKKTMKKLCGYRQPWGCTSFFPWTYWFNTYQITPTLTCID